MKTVFKLGILLFSILLSFGACKKDSFKSIKDVKLKVDFTTPVNASKIDMTKQTPDNYFVALKSVTLKGDEDTPDFEIFNESDLSSSFVFDFSDTETTHSLMQGTTVPDGEYSSVKIEIYYLQMKLNISASSGIEQRNIRIYLSDDAETESGLHQPGDMTQINTAGTEEGWMLGNGQSPDMTPISPRSAAYTNDEDDNGLGDGNIWFDFNGKPGNNFGPFGDADFMNNAPHPVYSATINFDLTDNGGENIIIDFNVNNCWQFEDRDFTGAFGAGDLSETPYPTKWNMALPIMSVTLE
ncbi:MAG: hypothetical protein DRI94_02255 [Bacteroidetes bacterium]|nr:MAG: hypothetical protein DRI94_02255 [Bacteroidota bacterium]